MKLEPGTKSRFRILDLDLDLDLDRSEGRDSGIHISFLQKVEMTRIRIWISPES